MKRIKFLPYLVFSLNLMLLICFNSSCERLYSKEISTKNIRERLFKKHKIKKEWMQLELMQEFPKQEDEKKMRFFILPGNMDILSDQFIYAVDIRSHKIFKFSKNAEYLDSFGNRGQGPGEFYFPNRIRISREGDIFVLDGRIKMQIFNSQGKYFRGFQVYHSIIDFTIADNSLIYASCLYPVGNGENPFIEVFDLNGKRIDSFGERIDQENHRTLDSRAFLVQSGKEIIAAFFHYPIVRRYTLEGKLIKEFRLNLKILNELEKYNYKKWFTNRRPGSVSLQHLIAGVKVRDERIFVLLQLPRLEILELNKEGKLIGHYYSMVPKNIEKLEDFIVRKEDNKLIFYVLQSYEEAKLYKFKVN